MVGLVHTPRTFYAIAKGLLRRDVAGAGAGASGAYSNSPFLSYGRAGLLFDCDYLWHMNNAAYLSHAEYARWEMSAANGMLKSMLRDNVSFVMGGATVRYRRDIRPLQKFQVQTQIAHLDDRNMWFYHTFRHVELNARIRAQVLCRGVVLQGKNVLDPRVYLVEKVGLNPKLVEEMGSSNLDLESSGSSDDDEMSITAQLIKRFEGMEESLKDASALDDNLVMMDGKKK
mmetsp:Transcript_14039/g.18302  ORF Transcript_14039/g.18302 Transcript_14039/m.18302 type:complete len:229 (+) Transcript_14039:112-798(+)|eukprot:CAMPEP_0198151860 /NCGR_PEP_ID=MMETSP1443-20131203/57451_1 /TAXON_ID=186043 /ORGANISM="Entomoneis sp., Strain CCMP2396" /LENGTH=228 /DNA_ID=CAMNT_0043817689 /DNA_START=40 /DNA_END=726 /DNA_ORIENTATION=+